MFHFSYWRDILANINLVPFVLLSPRVPSIAYMPRRVATPGADTVDSLRAELDDMKARLQRMEIESLAHQRAFESLRRFVLGGAAEVKQEDNGDLVEISVPIEAGIPDREVGQSSDVPMELADRPVTPPDVGNASDPPLVGNASDLPLFGLVVPDAHVELADRPVTPPDVGNASDPALVGPMAPDVHMPLADQPVTRPEVGQSSDPPLVGPMVPDVHMSLADQPVTRPEVGQSSDPPVVGLGAPDANMELGDQQEHAAPVESHPPVNGVVGSGTPDVPAVSGPEVGHMADQSIVGNMEADALVEVGVLGEYPVTSPEVGPTVGPPHIGHSAGQIQPAHLPAFHPDPGANPGDVEMSDATSGVNNEAGVSAVIQEPRVDIQTTVIPDPPTAMTPAARTPSPFGQSCRPPEPSNSPPPLPSTSIDSPDSGPMADRLHCGSPTGPVPPPSTDI
jgi:hypothetical protein